MPFIPLHDLNPRLFIRYPWVTWGVVLVCILIFVGELFADEDLQRSILFGFGMIPALVTGQATLDPDIAAPPAVLTVVTYMFLHGSVMHLVGNMLYLWVFGDNVEDAMGHGRFALFYGVCGVAAAALHMAIDPASRLPTIGASGAISGVLGAYLVLHPRARVLVPILFIPVYLPAGFLIVVWIGFQVLMGLGAPSGASGVAWWAHVGGFVTGMVLVRFFRRTGVPLFDGGRLPRGLKFRRPPDGRGPWG